jgi:hypothetical protein
MISVEGVLYLAIQNLLGYKHPAHGGRSQHGSDATIILSTDDGRHWRPSPKEMQSWPDKGVMFPGYKFGGPAFINFGRDNQGAVDGYVYAVSGDQWDNGTDIRLGRAPGDRIMHPSSWEWVAGFDKAGPAKPKWTSDLEASAPVLSDPRWVSTPEMAYVAPIKRYLLATWRLHKDFTSDAGTDLIVYEAPRPWGPFSWVYHEETWCGQNEINPYCPRIPLKWMSADGQTGWMQHSGAWGGDHRHYRSHIRKFRMKLKSP